MSTSELTDLELVIEQILPDPRGYAERVVQQLLERLAAPPAAPVCATCAHDHPSDTIHPEGAQP